MKVIGITGGIASGKTTASNFFKHKFKIPVFNADTVVARLYASKTFSERLKKYFKLSKTDKKYIVREIIGGHLKLKEYEKFFHTEILKRMEKFLRKNEKKTFVVLDVPLLFEVGWDKYCTATMAMKISSENQRVRAFQREDMTEEKYQKLLRRHLPTAEKCRRATFTINANKPKKEMFKELERIGELL